MNNRRNVLDKKKTGSGHRTCSRFLFLLSASALLGSGCALITTRPVQEMSDTTASLRAAKEVQADVLAPELYRQANEWFFKAKKEYKFKNFKFAKEFAQKARVFAEQAEFEAIRNGATRTEQSIPDPMANMPPIQAGDPTLGKPGQGAPLPQDPELDSTSTPPPPPGPSK